MVVNVLPLSRPGHMFPNLIDYLKAHSNGKEASLHDGAFQPDRRKRTRTRVHWPVRLRKEGAWKTIETVTHNLSSSGFYCMSAMPLTPGESLSCTLSVPAYDPKLEERTIALECRALVMRAEAAADGSFGIACRIEEYHLVRSCAS